MHSKHDNPAAVPGINAEREGRYLPQVGDPSFFRSFSSGSVLDTLADLEMPSGEAPR
nr:hypothetical protein [Rhodococcus wratislaviensis]